MILRQASDAGKLTLKTVIILTEVVFRTRRKTGIVPFEKKTAIMARKTSDLVCA